MAYTRENLLERALDVQKAFLEAQLKVSTMKYQRAGGYSKKWIFRHVIKPRFHIGYSTFHKYLGLAAGETKKTTK